MGTRGQNVVFSSNESDYNNWRGAQGAFYDWATGGTKLFGCAMPRSKTIFPTTTRPGVIVDTDNQNVSIKQATLSGNVHAGLQIERNEGPITLQNS